MVETRKGHEGQDCSSWITSASIYFSVLTFEKRNVQAVGTVAQLSLQLGWQLPSSSSTYIAVLARDIGWESDR